jgi:hypothetical protein
MKRIMLTILMALVSVSIFAQVQVTFRVDMGAQVFRGLFSSTTGTVVVRGDFQTDAGDPGGNWQGSFFNMTDPDGDTVYTITATFPSSAVGTTYNFKFVKDGDGWEGDPNRTFTLTAGPTQVLPVDWFNRDSSYVVNPIVTNTINFTADLSGILYVGAGNAFDPTQDSIQVMGLDWDGLGTNVQGNRTLTQDPFNAGIFRTTLTFQGDVDSTKWKFKAFPDARFSNGGWETGEDRWHVYGANGSVSNVGPIVPRIYPLAGPLSNNVTVIFRVDMNHNPVNRYNGQPIPVNQLQFVGMRGGADFLGSWNSGNWTLSDTTTGNMKVLNDAGVNGDLVAGDRIWSISIPVAAGTNGGFFEYKFAAVYPGADTVNGGSSPLDNEGGFGQNHGFFLRDSNDPLVFNHVFGVFGTNSVDRLEGITPDGFALEQNYPNPFNPSTKIRYSVPVSGNVTLKVFNLVGEQVGLLVNQEQISGVYEVDFSAFGMSSGVYFYQLSVGNYTATKKMILMK